MAVNDQAEVSAGDAEALGGISDGDIPSLQLFDILGLLFYFLHVVSRNTEKNMQSFAKCQQP